jgi:hypothetical protein
MHAKPDLDDFVWYGQLAHCAGIKNTEADYSEERASVHRGQTVQMNAQFVEGVIADPRMDLDLIKDF